MPQESSPSDAGEIPEQRSPAIGRHAAHAAPEDLPAPDETAVLPAFITGKTDPLPERKPTKDEPTAPTSPDGALPASERGMLIFVAALLGVGTLAVVVVLGLGGFSPQSAKAGSDPVPVATPSPTPSPSPSPSDPPSPSPSPSPTTHSPTPRRTSPSPTQTLLGALTAKDPAAYCISLDAGRPAQHSDHSWYCHSSGFHPPVSFTSTDVCRWRYLDKTAYAVAGKIDDPTTWKCYT